MFGEVRMVLGVWYGTEKKVVKVFALECLFLRPETGRRQSCPAPMNLTNHDEMEASSEFARGR